MMRRRLVIAIPFAVSLLLSLLTLGSTVGWQDSGFFLTAIHDLGVLHPPGFVLHLLLCKAWTLVLFFVDFTTAVHLFSALCAASASGTMAAATLDFLRAKGPVFGSGGDLDEEVGERAAVATGCLMACGFTLWSSALTAKGYSFFYLVLALLLRWMIRADGSARPRDFTVVAALIGCSWQAHPSATLAGAALILFVAAHRRTLGARGIAWRIGVAAACAVGPSLLLGVLASRTPSLQFSDPRSPAEVLHNLLGSRFVAGAGAFGLEGSRVKSIATYFWEEFLGVGLAAAIAGVAALVPSRRLALLFVACWSIPYTGVTTLFRIEGQHDHWFLAGWLPLWLLAGAGLTRIATKAGARGSALVAGLAVAGVGWAVVANYRDVDMRGYDLAESSARVFLEPLEPEAILLLGSDDSAGGTHYLQAVRKVQPRVTLIRPSHLAEPWYRNWLSRRHPGLRLDPGVPAAAVASFVNANASRERPVYLEVPMARGQLNPEFTVVPAGPMWKVVPKGEDTPDPRYWKFPIEPEAVRSRFRRARGQSVIPVPGGMVISPEPYERRLMIVLLRARRMLADWHHQRRNYEAAQGLYASILACDPETRELPDVVYPLATSLLALGRSSEAEPLFLRIPLLGAPPRMEAGSLAYVAEIRRGRGDLAGAREFFERALAVPGLDEAFRQEIGRRSGSR